MSNFTTPWPQFVDDNGAPLVGYYIYFGEPDQDPITQPKDVFDTDGVNLGNVVQLNSKGQTVVPVDLSDSAYSMSIYTDLTGNGGALYWTHPNFVGLQDLSGSTNNFWEQSQDTGTLEPILIMSTTAAPLRTVLDYTQLSFGVPSGNNPALEPIGPDYYQNRLFFNPSIAKAFDKMNWPTVELGAIDPLNDIQFNTGFIFSTSGVLIDFDTQLTKRLDATWAAGDGNGGLFSGTVANDTSYHLFTIYDELNNVTECGMDIDINCANIPTGYTQYRRIGSIRTETGSTNIRPFAQVRDYFYYESVTATYQATAGITRQLIDTQIPTGSKFKAMVNMSFFDLTTAAVSEQLLITDPDRTNVAPSSTIYTLAVANSNTGSNASDSSYIEMTTNTSAQLGARSTLSTPDLSVTSSTYGWIDDRN